MTTPRPTPPPPPDDALVRLRSVHDHLAELERERHDLNDTIAAQEKLNAHLEDRLALLSQPLSEGKRWRWYQWLLLMMIIAGALVALDLYQTRRQESARAARRELLHAMPKVSQPHLLVTSRPSGETVFINDQRFSFQGHPATTPFLYPVPKRERGKEITIRIGDIRQSVVIGQHTGAHLHIVRPPLRKGGLRRPARPSTK